MVVGRILSSCVVVLLGACAAAPASPGAASAPAPSGPSVPKVEDLRAAVFEVVIPKYENPGMAYAEPLPVHLLPHHERNDPYDSIGTAFTLDGITFVSAAHVFSLHAITQLDDRRLRGVDGKIHLIDQFVGYSGSRDLVAFTLRDAPAALKPLARGSHPEVGAQVYTVGNALGEGLSVRGGNVASFTPEPLDGAWNFIRYSAPASPGNSGGPLLDDHGRVVGVVVRKSSDENLNYAVPIEELERLSTSRADFYSRLGEVESRQELVADWRFEADLPASYPTLATQSQTAFIKGTLDHRVAFEHKFADKIFPGAPELRTFLRQQVPFFYPAQLDRDPSGRWWAQGATDNHAYEIGPDQQLYLGKTGTDFYLALERPDDVPLATFVNEPQRVIDALLGALDLNRTYAGASIRITSYGPAHHQESWRDAYGRPWTSTTWRVIGDGSKTLHCTPYPRGLACMLDETYTYGEALHVPYARINSARWVLSYDGRVKDWIEYLALDPALRPAFMSGAVTLAGPKLSVQLGPIAASASHPDLSGDSFINVGTEYASVTPAAMRVSSIQMVTTKTRGMSLRVARVAQPLASGTQEWRDYWDDLVAAKAPFDGKVVRDAETSEIQIVDETGPTTYLPDERVEARALVACWTGDNAAVSDAALGKACTAFRKSIQISAN